MYDLPDAQYIVSMRGKQDSTPIKHVLNTQYNDFKEQITSIFCFAEYTPLYGGRTFGSSNLSNDDVEYLYSNNIGIRLPLTNLFPTDDMYTRSQEVLKKYHRAGNSIVLSNDYLLSRIREDFPMYNIEYSVIADCRPSDVDSKLELFDTVVLHGRFNKPAILENIVKKDRVILFEGMRCAANCPDKVCYKYFSQVNSNSKITYPTCSQHYIPRPNLGFVSYDLASLYNLGFRQFKVLPRNGNIV